MSFLINFFITIGMFFQGIGLIRTSHRLNNDWDFLFGVLLIIVSLMYPLIELHLAVKRASGEDFPKK